MSAVRDLHRLPRSIRKHLRSEKARLRRELPPTEARRAIERLIQAVHHEKKAGPAAVATERDDRQEITGASDR